jgi:hypothetical protein
LKITDVASEPVNAGDHEHVTRSAETLGWSEAQCGRWLLPLRFPERIAKPRLARRNEIMAITGDQTLEKAERYTKAASRKKTADAAMQKLQRR